ncbi:MAG: manganese efflux pump MntP family protein [Tractidigestivibacter sp.]|uniref:manganese efflux pump MntP n=1 Tax=Tractidigestivibacter sp. TaxID=2847320 RepID=UPI003D8CB7B8
MSVAEIFILGLALSADAFSVTISNCFAYQHETLARRALMPILFGLFQALMPVAGYYLSGIAGDFIERYSGIITLVILGIIGGNMVREGVLALRESKRCGGAPAVREGHLTVSMLLFQAVATAIDAFAIGVSLRAQAVDLAFSVTVIGLTTAACCILALVIGRKLGDLLGDRAEILGGCVLIAIGIKALLS